MAVNQQTPRNVSTAAPGATVFPYDFKIIQSADLQVTVDGVEKTLGVHFTVDGVGLDAGGNVTFLTPMVGGEKVMRRRNMALERTTDFQMLGDLLAPTLNNDQDAPILMAQQLAEQLARAMTLPPESTASGTLPLPVPFKPLVWNADGTALENGDPVLSGDLLLRGDLASGAAGKGGALVAFKRSEAGAVARTVYDRLLDVVNVKDFGAKGDGVTDDLVAFNAAAAAGRHVYVPESPNPYNLSGQWVLPDKSIRITGASNLASRLRWTGAVGGIKYMPSVGDTTLEIEDIALTTSYNGTAYGVYVEYPASLPSVRPEHVRMDRVRICGDVGLTNFFTNGVYLKGTRSCRLSNLSILGAFNATNRGNVGFWLDGQCINVLADMVSVAGYTTGYKVTGATEGAQFYNCQTSLLVEGLHIETTAGRPHMVVESCHFNTADIGIKIVNAVQIFIRGCLLYSSGQEASYSSAGYTGIWLVQDLANVDNAVISDNIVVGLQSINEDGLRIDGGANFISCRNNQFSGLTGTALKLNASIANSDFGGNLAPNTAIYASGLPASSQKVQMRQPDGAGALFHSNVGAVRYETNGNGAAVNIAKARGDIGAPTSVAAGDNIGGLSFKAHDGSTFNLATIIDAVVYDATAGAIKAVLRAGGPFRLGTYTVATVPPANMVGGNGPGSVIYVSNGNSGSPCLAVSNGTSWLRIALGTAISAT